MVAQRNELFKRTSVLLKFIFENEFPHPWVNSNYIVFLLFLLCKSVS